MMTTKTALSMLALSALLSSPVLSHAMMNNLMRTGLAASCIAKKAFLPESGKRNLSFGFFYIVRQQQRVIIERLGKYQRTLGPGFHLKWPILDEARSIEYSYVNNKGDRVAAMVSHIDLREITHLIPSQKVITQDNVAMTIDGILYASISNPEKVVYNIKDVNAAIESLSQTTLRDVIGAMNLDATLTSRDVINHTLKEKLAASAERWGITVNHVELKEILPPKDIQHAMESQMKADREKRAKILTAEGERQAAIQIAEGEKAADIKRAEGKSQAVILDAEAHAKARLALAEAEARSMEAVQKAAPGQNALAYLIATKYINALPTITEGKAGKTVVVPYDATSLAGVTSLIKNFLAESETSKPTEKK